LGTFRPDLPLKLQLIVDRALAKKPSDRFPDVDHLVHAIEEHLLPADPDRRILSPTLTLGTSSTDESQRIPLPTVTSAGDSGPTRIPATALKRGAHALFERRTLAAALLVGVLLASPWLALHGRGKHSTHAPDAPQPAHAAAAPLITKLASVPQGSPGVEADPVAVPRAGEVAVRATPAHESQLGHPTGNSALRERSARAQKASRGGADRRRASQQHLPTNPRAGKLSTSDF
jgi:hypothetical protein